MPPLQSLELSVLSLLPHPNIDPVIFQLGDTPLALRWYGLMYVLAFTVGYLFLRWLQKTGYLRCKAEDITNIIVYGVLGTFVGGRLGYLLFYQFDKLVLNKDNMELGARIKMIFAVWDGGMSFHGGVFGVGLAVLLYAWRHKASVWNVLDAGVHIVPLGVALVRVGNFINGELYGRAITDDAGKPIYDADKLPWYAMKFPTDHNDAIAQGKLMRALQDDWMAANPGASYRDIPNEALHPLPVKPEIWEQVQQYFPGRYPSQAVQFLFEGVTVLLLVWLIRRRLKFPGQLAGAFLMLYALFRIPAEMIRQPDSQIDPAQAEALGGTAQFLHSIGLTMGQFLSVVIFGCGLAMFFMHRVAKLRGKEYSSADRRGGFWRETIRDFPEIIGVRKKKPAPPGDTPEAGKPDEQPPVAG